MQNQLSNTESASNSAVWAERSLWVSKARHDLHSFIGHIMGFSEMWLENAQAPGSEAWRSRLEFINRTARGMMDAVSEELTAQKVQAGLSDLGSLERQICEQTADIIRAAEVLVPEQGAPLASALCEDLVRIIAAARQAGEAARTSLGMLTGSVAERRAEMNAPSNPLIGLLAPRAEAPMVAQTRREGSILVVDDMESNRELLARRLSRLGYTIQVVENGHRALEVVEGKGVDVILLDIFMPGLDGFAVLQRLKANRATQHIPVIMLSSDDQLDTAVRCIQLGADDFLPQPFNPTLLMARIESSLSKKLLRDQENAFLKRLQAEQETSERLLLNILPKAIAERLKRGERVIADSHAEVTVLFSDFVGFTKLSAGISPKALVGHLNEIFSIFDRLCEQHGLEKIKMIGDAYMAVSGVPTPRADHAQAAADLALNMQREVALFAHAIGLPFRIRVGLNSGPVVAGVIGAKKFTYDLWGDTVNLANRMEAHAPPGGILVAPATCERLGGQYQFQSVGNIQVKGKGELSCFLLLGGPKPRLLTNAAQLSSDGGAAVADHADEQKRDLPDDVRSAHGATGRGGAPGKSA